MKSEIRSRSLIFDIRDPSAVEESMNNYLCGFFLPTEYFHGPNNLFELYAESYAPRESKTIFWASRYSARRSLLQMGIYYSWSLRFSIRSTDTATFVQFKTKELGEISSVRHAFILNSFRRNENLWDAAAQYEILNCIFIWKSYSLLLTPLPLPHCYIPKFLEIEVTWIRDTIDFHHKFMFLDSPLDNYKLHCLSDVFVGPNFLPP